MKRKFTTNNIPTYSKLGAKIIKMSNKQLPPELVEKYYHYASDSEIYFPHIVAEQCAQIAVDYSLEKDKEIQLLSDENDMLETDIIQVTKQRNKLVDCLKDCINIIELLGDAANLNYGDETVYKAEQLLKNI